MMVLSGVEIVMAKNFRSVYLINYYQWYWVISIRLILFFFLVINMLLVNGAISSAGEHYIDIVGVTGSIPVSPTILFYRTNKSVHRGDTAGMGWSLNIVILLSAQCVSGRELQLC